VVVNFGNLSWRNARRYTSCKQAVWLSFVGLTIISCGWNIPFTNNSSRIDSAACASLIVAFLQVFSLRLYSVSIPDNYPHLRRLDRKSFVSLIVSIMNRKQHVWPEVSAHGLHPRFPATMRCVVCGMHARSHRVGRCESMLRF
jgi:hypothetical protein